MADDIPRHVLVFGATGGTGAAIVREASRRGYAVRAFVRDAERGADTFADLAQPPELIVGDAHNEADARRACAGGVNVVFDAMGIYQPRAGGTDLTEATRNVLTAMRAADIRRYVGISSLGVGDSKGQGNWLVKLIQGWQLKHTLADKEQQEALIRAGELDWTIVRPARLLNGSGPATMLVWHGSEPATRITWAVNRSDVARFAVDCLDNADSIGKAFSMAGQR